MIWTPLSDTDTDLGQILIFDNKLKLVLSFLFSAT